MRHLTAPKLKRVFHSDIRVHRRKKTKNLDLGCLKSDMKNTLSVVTISYMMEQELGFSSLNISV